jgi:hypothetical protein
MPPAGAKAEAALRKKKDAKQKKILIALVPLLLLLLFWQGPGMLKALSGGEAAPPPPTVPPATTVATDPTAPPSPSAPGVPPADPAAPLTLSESDVPLPADSGQLISFDRFIGKDPFKQQVVARSVSQGDEPPAATTPGTTPGGATTPPGGANTPPGGATTPTDFDPGDPVTVTYALIKTNGERETVGVDATFPTGDPIFRLAALTPRRAAISLVTGSFSNGHETVKVDVGDSITLVSQPDGIRYKITIVSVG